MNLSKMKDFVAPFYAKKDEMHNFTHIERVCDAAMQLIGMGNYKIDRNHLTAGIYFHGLINAHENEVLDYLNSDGIAADEIGKIIQIANESHAASIPISLEGKIAHDAHLIEGGKVYMVTKCLITGTLRGQTLLETIAYIEEHIIDKRECLLPEAIPLFKEANQFTKEFIRDLNRGIRG